MATGVGLLALCSIFASCGRQTAAPADGTVAIELRSYEVPPEQQDDLREMLQSALSTDDGRFLVTNGPGGTLLVTAPARIQEGIEQVLNRDFDVPPSSSQATLTYWFVVGRQGDPSQTPPPFSVVGRPIPQLEAVLAQIANTAGTTEFSLLERVQLTSMNQKQAQAYSKYGIVRQQTARSGEQVVVDVDISLDTLTQSAGRSPYGVNSRVMLAPGQFLVLGQTGLGGTLPDAFPTARGGSDLTLYYVMSIPA